MDHEKCAERRESTQDIECRRVPPDVEKSSSLANRNVVTGDDSDRLETQFASPTPPQIVQPSRIKQKGTSLTFRAAKKISEFFPSADGVTKSEVENSTDADNKSVSTSNDETSSYAVREVLNAEADVLPDNYEILAEFFDRLDSSIRLLSLCKKLSTFQNICIQMGIFTKRKFLCKHLAQIKYIFPEVVRIEKILTHDKITLCMRPDMKITLLPDAVDIHQDQSKSMALCQMFRSRLVGFLKMQPEGLEIPEALLPEPFNQQNLSSLTLAAERVPARSQLGLVDSEPILSSSHLPPFFHSRFSQNNTVSEIESFQLSTSQVSHLPITIDYTSCQDTNNPLNRDLCSSISTSTDTTTKLPLTPSRFAESSYSDTTPLKLVFTPLAETPALYTPKRPVPSPSECTYVESEKPSNSATKRHLDFSFPLEVVDGALTSNVDLMERSKVENVEVVVEDHNMSQTGALTSNVDLMERSKVENVEVVVEDHNMSQTGAEKRRLMLACLPDLFNVIQLIFQNADYSFITKQELTHKILWHNCDITETREIEELLELFEELIPDWICKRKSLSGDFLYCIKRTSGQDSIRAKLVDAV